MFNSGVTRRRALAVWSSLLALLGTAVLLACSSSPANSQGNNGGGNNGGNNGGNPAPGAVVAQTDLAKPAVGAAYNDPRLGARVVRLTDARAGGISGIFPDYSKRQAWNADESRLLLRTGDGDARLYDGNTYNFLRQLDPVGGEDVLWHPTDPDLLYFNPDNALHRYRVSDGDDTIVHTFANYAFANTRGEGNLSLDGRWYALCGQTYDQQAQEVHFQDLVVYDIVNDAVTATLALPAVLPDFDWVSISPLGGFVVVDYASTETARFRGVEVYDRALNFVWQRPLGAGHSDLGLDAAGNEVLVMAIYDPERNVNDIKSYRLSDGRETTLLTTSELFDMHFSCRASDRRGWCLVSTFDFQGRLTDSAATWLPYEDEVFALNLDGSGTTQRLCHHHSRRYSPATPDSDTSCYFSEPHATASRTGTRVVFGSNWRDQIADCMSVDAYVVEWPATGR